MADGRWTVDRPDIRTGPIPIPPLPFEGARLPRERITKQKGVSESLNEGQQDWIEGMR